MSLLDVGSAAKKYQPDQNLENRYIASGQSLVLSDPIFLRSLHFPVKESKKFSFTGFLTRKNQNMAEKPKIRGPLTEQILQFEKEYVIFAVKNLIKVYRYREPPSKNKSESMKNYENCQQTNYSKINHNITPESREQFIEKYSLKSLVSIQLEFEEIRSIRIFQWTETMEKNLKESFKDRPKVLNIVAENHESTFLQLVSFDKTHKRLRRVDKIVSPTLILCWNFIYHNEILVWTNNMYINHYVLDEAGFHCIRTMHSGIDPKKELYEQKIIEKKSFSFSKTNSRSNSQPKKGSRDKIQSKIPGKGLLDYFIKPQQPVQREIQKTQTIILDFEMNFCSIMGYRDPEQQKIIPLFYTLYNEEYNVLKIKCLEIMYPIEPSTQITKSYYSKIIGGFIQKVTGNPYPQIYLKQRIHEIKSHNLACPESLSNVEMLQLGNSYYLKLKSEMIFIEKKYDDYFAIDSVSKMNPQNEIIVTENYNLLASFNEEKKTLEINEINGLSILDDKTGEEGKAKVSLKMIDFIDLQHEIKREIIYNNVLQQSRVEQIDKEFAWYLPQQSTEKAIEKFDFFEEGQKQNKQGFLTNKNIIKVHKIWLNKIDIDLEFCFILEVTNQEMIRLNRNPLICVYNGLKISKEKKILKLAQESATPEDLLIIKDLGAMLGISETQFYLNLWKYSKQRPQEIKQYLLPCNNYTSIVQQIKAYLRRRPMYITQLMGIGKYLVEMMKNKLKDNLSEENLKQYFNCEFVLRKLNIYESNYMIEEEEFNKALDGDLIEIINTVITEAIHPKMKKYSIWQGQQKTAPKLELVVILDMFKLPLLDDYTKFLSCIYEKHKHEIVEVLEHFPELLPNYPFFTNKTYNILKNSVRIFRKNVSEKQVTEDLVEYQNQIYQQNNGMLNQIKQVGVFGEILPKNFAEEPAFIHNLTLSLDKYHSCSYLLKTIDNLLKVDDEKSGQVINKKAPMVKLYNHMMIKSEIGEFIENIQQISGQNLYIYTLEFIIKNAKKQNQKSNISQLISLYERHYSIPKEILKKLKLRAGLYQIIILNHILDDNSVSLFEVVDTPIEKWIALFFLGNKQQKQLLCNAFMELYDDHQEYTEDISQFIKSQHCSKIQLAIMSEQVAKLSVQSQLASQNLVTVIINGFCEKIRLKDTAQCNSFLYHINKIHFCPELLFKVDRIEKFKICLRIFEVFFMEEKTLSELLNNTFGIIAEMMEAFFSGDIRREQVPIKKGFILIEDCYGMWDLLCYLKNAVFFDITTQQLLLSYCKKLIEWQRFVEVQYLLYESDKIETSQDEQQIKSTIVCNRIIEESISALYHTENLLFDVPVKQYIRNIIGIDKYPAFNKFIIKEEARLKLVEILESWGYQVVMNDLLMMCNQWQACNQQAKNQDELGGIYLRPIMVEIIEKYGKHLDFKNLQLIYGYFVTATQGTEQPRIKTDEFYNYCSKLCETLLNNNRLKQLSEIIYILNEKFEMNYLVMVECMIRSLLEKFEEQFKQVKRLRNTTYNSLEESWAGFDLELEADSEIIDETEHDRIESKQSNHQERSYKMIHDFMPAMGSKKKTDRQKIKKWKLIPTQSLIKEPKDIAIKYQIEDSLNIFESFNPAAMVQKNQNNWKVEACWKMKRYVEYFVINWIAKKEEKLNSIYRNFFQSDITIEDNIDIALNHDICFKNHRHRIDTDTLWNIVVFGVSQKAINRKPNQNKMQSKITLRSQANIEQLIYTYFIMLMGITEPILGFEMLQYISYSHHTIVKTFMMMENWCNTVKNLLCIDYSIIFKIYLNSLTKLMVYKYEGDGFFEFGYSDNPYILAKDPGEQGNQEPLIIKQFHKQVIADNLELFRQSLKEGMYKDDPLHIVVLKMAEMTNKAKKQSGYRLRIYVSSVQNKKFSLEDKLKKLNRKDPLLQKEKEEEKHQADQQIKIDESMNDSSLSGMRFEDFRKMKKKILLDEKNKSRASVHSQYFPNEITERSVVHEIMRQFNSNKDACSELNIPGQSHNETLRNFVYENIRQLQENQKEEQQQYPSISKDLSFTISPDRLDRNNRTMPLSTTPPKTKQTKIRNINQFIELINSNEYSIIDFWSPDAIFLETLKCYNDDRVSFVKVIQMFYQLMVGNNNKINIIISCLPDSYEGHLKTRENILKAVFPMKFLSKDFPLEYTKFYDEMVQNIMKITDEATIQEMIEIGFLINQICAIEYRKSSGVDWRLIIGEIGIKRIARNGVYGEKAIQQIYNILMIFKNIKTNGIGYLKDSYSVILEHFKIGESPQLQQCFEEACKIVLGLNTKELRQEIKLKMKKAHKNMEDENILLDEEAEENGPEVFQETDSFID